MPEARSLNEHVGINVHGNPLTLPAGTAIECKNFKCVRDNVYTKVRGRKCYGSGLPAQDISQFYQYQDRLFCHMGNDTIYYDSDGTGTFTQKTGAFTVPEAGYRVQSLEYAGNSYIATGTGIRKIDALTDTYISAGAPKGLSFDLRIVSSTNWLTTAYTVAYRHVWSITDDNSNQVDGPPSERQEVTNSSGADRAVNLRIILPTDVTVDYDLKVYRSSQGTATTPPEDFQLVYQVSPTAAEIAAGLLEFTDILPDDWRGESLYTNTTQEGIAKANERPPLANVITTYKNFVFYGNIQNLHRLYTALVSVSNLTAGTSTVVFNDGTNTITFGCYIFTQDVGGGVAGAVVDPVGAVMVQITTTGAHGLATGACVNIFDVLGTTEANGDWSIEVTAATTFLLVGSTFANLYVSGGTIDLRINNLGATTAATDGVTTMADTPATLIRVTTDNLHGLTTGDYVRISDTVGTVEANGTWQVTVIDTVNFDLVGSTFAVAYVSGGTIDLYEDYGATPRFILHNRQIDALNIARTARSLVRTVNLCTTNTFWYGYYNSSAIDPAGKIEFTAQSLGGAAFYLIANSTDTGGCFSPNMPIAGTTYFSINDNFQHAVMWSKQDQGEAVPLINIKKLGSADDPILGIVGLRDSLFVIKKKDGIHRLTGETESSFNWDEFDGTVECLQLNTIVKGESSVFMFSDSGFAKISDVGVEIIGRDTEKDDLKPIAITNFDTAGYGWYYESEKAYKVSTYLNQDSTSNDILKEFNAFTQAWAQREYGVYTNDTDVSAGIVVDGVEYTAPLSGNGLLAERKDIATTDYTLPDVSNTITVIDEDNVSVTLGTAIVIHDAALLKQGALTRVVSNYDSTTQLTLRSIAYLATNTTLTASGMADNGAGLIRVTTTANHLLTTYNGITIAGTVGTVEANGDWLITVIDATHFDLIGSTFAIAYASGGAITNEITIKPGIYSELKYQTVHGGYPEYEKLFNAISAFFDNDETSIRNLKLKTSTDADSTTVETEIDKTLESIWEGLWSGGWGDVSVKDKLLTLVPEEHARCSNIYFHFIHNFPQERLDITGYSTIFEITDDRYQT